MKLELIKVETLSYDIKKDNAEVKEFIELYNIKPEQVLYMGDDIPDFPVMKLVKELPKKDSLFETILVSVNDTLVENFLQKKINRIIEKIDT